MAEELPVRDIAAVERLVQQVRCVQAVRAVLDAQGQIDELHVVGSPDRSPKAIVRDIESILYVRGGVRVNHRKISLVQVPEGSLLTPGTRVQLVRVAGGADGGSVSVTLATAEAEFQGVAQFAGPEDAYEMVVGRATIDALSQIVGARGTFQVELVQRQPFGELEVCLAHVSLVLAESLETLLGVSVVRRDALASPARAVLDAVNRRLPSLLGGSARQGR